jgi:hypothetical protein
MRAFLERHFETVDRIAVAALAGLLFAYSHYLDHDAGVLGMFAGNRTAVYGAIIGLFGTIFGFGLTAMSIVLAFAESPRLRILRRSRHWATLWRVFTRGLRTFIIVALVALGGIILDRDRAPRLWVVYVVVLFVLLGIMRVYRVLWAFENLTLIMNRPEQNEEEQHDRETEHRETVKPALRV